MLAAAVKAIGGTERPARSRWPTRLRSAWTRIIICWFRPHWDRQVTWLSGSGAAVAGPASEQADRRATATLALQSQLANNDIPAAIDAVESVTGNRPRHAILKGRANYVCLLRLRDTAEDQGALNPDGRSPREH